MTSILNFKRLGSLISKEINENIPKISVLIGISILVSIIGWLFTLFTSSHLGISSFSRSNTITIIVTIAFFILPYTLYNHLNHKKSGIESAMLPASITEKYLSMVLVSVVIIPLAILISCISIDYIIALISPNIYTGYLFGESSNNIFAIKPGWEVISSIFVMSGVSLFGNLLFRKNKILKTVLTVFAINVVILIIGIILIKNGVHIFDFAGLENVNSGNNVKITIGKPGIDGLTAIAKWIKIVASVVIPILLYYGTYYRLKHLKF